MPNLRGVVLAGPGNRFLYQLYIQNGPTETTDEIEIANNPIPNARNLTYTTVFLVLVSQSADKNSVSVSSSAVAVSE